MITLDMGDGASKGHPTSLGWSWPPKKAQLIWYHDLALALALQNIGGGHTHGIYRYFLC